VTIIRILPRLVALALLPLGAMPAVADLAGPYLAARQAARSYDFREATGYFSQAVAQDPTNQRLIEGAVLASIGAGRVAAALPYARRLASFGNRAQPTLIVLAADQLERRAYDDLLADINAGRSIGPLIDGLMRAWAELGAGRMSEAQAAFDRLGASQGMSQFGLYHKALALASVGDLEGAAGILGGQDGGMRQTRRGVIAHAQILSQLDRHAEALGVLDAVFGADADPEITGLRDRIAAGQAVPFDVIRDAADGQAEVFFTIATVLQGEASDDQTLLYSRIAEFLRPDHDEATLLSASLLSALGQGRLAIEAYGRVTEASPAYVEAQSGRAQALYALGEHDEAIGVLQALAAAHPAHQGVHMTLGDLLRRQERYVEAAASYSRALDLIGPPEQRHWSVFYARAIAYERAKDWDRAEPDFRKALELNPGQPQVLNYLGYSFLELNRNLDEAMAMIEQAVAARPDDGYIIDSLAWGHFLLGRFDEAVEPMERASLLMPVDPIVTDHLGDVYWAVGRKLEAAFQWRRALSFEPEPEAATRIRRKLEVGLDAVLVEEGATPLAERRHANQ
jgi:Flp pilus assembly protein TadD